MASINTSRQAYTATVELAFDYNGIREDIDPEKIVYIMIEHDYENQVLPVIFISLSVNNDLYNKIVKYKESAKFYLNIKKSNKNSIASLSKKSISGSFNYIPSTSNPNFQEDLTDVGDFLDNSYKRIMIGLVSIELTNALRKSFNQVYNNIDQKTLIGLALEGTNCVIEQIPYNQEYSSILIPPISSRYQMLNFIFKKDNFYDTNFRYFMDFERSYLLSKRGDPIDAGDGQLSSVIVDIRSVTEEESYFDGIEIKNGAYYIYINPSNSNVTLNEGTEKVANQIVSIDDDSLVQQLNLDINNSQGSSTKQMFIRSDNAALYKNELETNTIITEIIKQHIDGSYFTPNRSILVNHYGEYSKYNGKYLMIYKREFYKCIAGEFVMSCNVGLKKIGNIQAAQSTSSRKSYGYARNSATKKSTNTKKIYSIAKPASGINRKATLG